MIIIFCRAYSRYKSHRLIKINKDNLILIICIFNEIDSDLNTERCSVLLSESSKLHLLIDENKSNLRDLDAEHLSSQRDSNYEIRASTYPQQNPSDSNK